jgi:resuscitation-promoting factor RpfB
MRKRLSSDETVGVRYPQRAGRRPGQKVAVIIGSAVTGLLLVGCAGTSTQPPADRPTAAQQPPVVRAPIVSAPPTTTPPPTVAHTKSTVIEEEAIPFGVTTVKDASLPKGTTRVRTRGVPGLKRITYEVTYANGVETGREKVREEVVRKPVTKVVAVGTKQPSCDPNYAGACVPIASDVDCAGGSGNGPAYVEGPVQVVGEDIYGLDYDNDGIGCE